MDQSSSDFFHGTREESIWTLTFSDFRYLEKSGEIRDQSLTLSEIAPNFACFWPPISLGGGPPNFWTCVIKNAHIAIIWQSFAAIGHRSSEVARRIKKNICSRTRHPGTNVLGGLITAVCTHANGDMQ